MPENVYKVYQSRVFFVNYAIFSLDIPKKHKFKEKNRALTSSSNRAEKSPAFTPTT
jgi:hypothetical protein